MPAPPPPSASDFGRSLTGFGVNLIVRDLDAALTFVTQVLGATLRFRTERFAALVLCGDTFMLHTDETYRSTPLSGSLAQSEARGVGIELRAYHVDPDAAEARARTLGFTVLAGSLDKPHGLRECMLLDAEGYVWVPSRHVAPERDGHV